MSRTVMTGMPYPLDALYARCGVAPPVARRLTPGAMPALAARLLARDGELTRTLGRHVGDRLLIRVLATMRQPNPGLRAVFGAAKPAPLDGRQTRLMTGIDRRGEVVEVLASL